MTDLPPPSPQPPRRSDLGFDEFIGILVAFASIGAILFWSMTRPESSFNVSFDQTPPAPSATPSPSTANKAPAPDARVSAEPSSVPSPVATVTPSPDEVSVVPFAISPPAPKASVGESTVITSPPPSPSPSTSASPSPVATGFSDVSSNYWAAPFVAVLAQRGIIDGFPDRTFRPGQPVTRAEFATMIQKAFNKPATRPAVQFADLAPTYWANAAIDEAVRTGFLTGYPNQVFRPNQAIPKVQAIVALANGLQLTQSGKSTVLSRYQDASQIPAYATGKVANATQAGLVVNYPNPDLFNPDQVTTRADAAALIYQALVLEGKAGKISSQYVIQP